MCKYVAGDLDDIGVTLDDVMQNLGQDPVELPDGVTYSVEDKCHAWFITYECNGDFIIYPYDPNRDEFLEFNPD